MQRWWQPEQATLAQALVRQADCSQAHTYGEHCPEVSTGMMGLACVQDFSAAFSRLLELGVPFPEGAPAT